MSARAMPRHEAVEKHLRIRIASLQPGDPIESEAALCQLFQVSRMTVRQAMNKLVAEGAIYRISGVGTFVGHPEVHREMGKLRSFTAEMELRGARASSKLISKQVRLATKEELASLRLTPGSMVVEIKRLRLADDVPMALETTALTPALAWVMDEDVEKNSMHSLFKEHGVELAKATGTQVATLAVAEDAKHLDLKPGSAIFLEKRLVSTKDGTPVEFTESRYDGSRFVFHIELSA